MKYKKALIFISIIYGFFILMIALNFLFPSTHEGDITPLIPGTATIDLTILFLILIPLGAVIGSLLGCLISPLFLVAHKKIVGRSLSYSIQERPSPTKFKKLYRGLFPSLMAINFGLMLSDNSILRSLILTQSNLSENSESAIIILMIVFLMGWAIGAAFALFSSAWLLTEAGIVYNNKEKLKDSDYPIEVRSVGGWYSYLFKGYAGISVIINLYIISSQEIFRAGESGEIALFLTLIFFPFLITIFVFPSVVLFDFLKNHRNNFIRKFAHKLGIINIIEVDIREIQK